MANWNLPTLADLYSNFLSYMKDRDLDLAKALDPASVTVTNPVSGMVRFNSAENRWETFNGTIWSPSATTYAIDAATAQKWTTGRTIALTGDASAVSAAFDGSANLSFTLTLSNSGVTAGTYGVEASRTVPIVTVDSKGRVTSASSWAVGTMATQSASAVAITGGAVSGVDLTLKGSVSPVPTAEGRMEWDTDNDRVAVGSGAATKTISPDDVAATLQNKTLGSGTTVTASITVNGQTVTIANFGYLAGATSNIQTQLNGKLSTTGTAANSSKLTNLSPSTSATDDTVAVRDAVGDLTARLFRSTYPEQTTPPADTADIAFREDTTNNYIKFMSLSAIKTWLGIASLGNLASLNTVSSAYLDNYAVTAIKLPALTAGNWLLHDSTYLTTGVTTTNTKFVERRCPRSGVIRTRVFLNRTGSIATVYGRVYKNGVAYGTLRSTSASGYWTEDLSFVEGDLIQFYIYSSVTTSAVHGLMLGVSAPLDHAAHGIDGIA